MQTKQIRSAPLEWGAGKSKHKHKNSTRIIARFWGLVKLYRGRVLQSFRKNEAIVAPIQFSQEICDPTGIKLRVILAPPIVFITDKNGSVVEFSAYLVPELRASLLEVEAKFGRGAK